MRLQRPKWPTIFELRCLVWQFCPLSLSCVTCFILRGRGAAFGGAPFGRANHSSNMCVTAFGGAPFGRAKY